LEIIHMTLRENDPMIVKKNKKIGNFIKPMYQFH